MRAHIHIGCVLLLGGALASATESSFVGYARSLDTGRLLYVETHLVSRDPTGPERRLVLYRCASGAAPFARKELAYGADRSMPTFTFADARSGFAEGLERGPEGLRVYARGPRDVTTRDAALAAGAFVADAGFDEFVRGHWDALAGGAVLEVPFLVPTRLRTMPFRVRRLRGERIDGEPATVFRLSLAGALGWFLPDIDVSYLDRGRQLARYRGLTNIRDASGALLAAEIDFRAAVPVVAEDAERLRALPLVSHCN